MPPGPTVEAVRSLTLELSTRIPFDVSSARVRIPLRGDAPPRPYDQASERGQSPSIAPSQATVRGLNLRFPVGEPMEGTYER